jgi:DNA-binding response OmpR family regulator
MKITNTPTTPSPRSNAELLQFTQPWPLSLPPERRPGAGKPSAARTRILVAEDDAVSRELICTRLAKWGYDVVSTRNGSEAMAELRKKDAPSLAILDWMMPDMDGLEICRRVREVDRVLYVIMLTARDRPEDLVEGLGAGADDYLIKPFEKNELQARILSGLRVIALQVALAARVKELELASAVSGELKRQFMM